ncbi:MAG: hypothetical protein JWQ71_1161 [Pedosphaera sp.]|nr:hypothetical protein [Pedosphaera sp.]
MKRACVRRPDTATKKFAQRLHTRISESLTNTTVARLFPPRTKFCLTLVTAVNDKLILAVEILSPEDHRWDTVTKKAIYEQIKVPRLWMVDPRYNNVEVYHANEYGLSLKQILATREVLSDPLLPNIQYDMAELFKI